MWDNKKLGIMAAVLILVLVSVIGGFKYVKQKAIAREAEAKQSLISAIDNQHALEDQAKADKSKYPVVSEEYPAKIIPKPVAPSTDNSASSKEIPQQSFPLLKDAPKQTITPPPVSQEPVQAITTLSDTDIQRLQSYKQFDGGELYHSFSDMYSNQRANCDGIVTRFSPVTLSDYSQAKVEWLTNPTLVYKSVTSQYCIRGVLGLTYYSAENKFGLIPNVKYQGDVEYRLRNSVTQGQMTLKLESINYLSEFRAVK